MMEERVPDWLLERYLLDELPPDQLEALRHRLEAEPDGQDRLAELRRSNRELLERHPPAAMAAAIRQRVDGASDRVARAGAGLHQPDVAARASVPAATRRRSDGLDRRFDAPPPWLRRLAIGGAFAAPLAAAILVVALLPGSGTSPHPSQGGDGLRLKGLSPQLVAHRQGRGEPERLVDGAAIRPNELLQLSYVAAGRAYGVVVSIDGAGVVTLHHPIGGSLAAPLEQDGAVPLPIAYELDDAPGFERFVFVSAEDAFSVEEVLEAARALALDAAAAAEDPLPLPSQWEQTSLTLRKPR